MAEHIKHLKKPYFVISLDFELFWGVFDQQTINKYGKNIIGVHTLIPKLLSLFKEYDIHVTWASVGLLFYKDITSLKQDLPAVKPSYLCNEYSAYNFIDALPDGITNDYISGYKLLDLIDSYPNQEIATHTYSHYYCLEEGQNIQQFESDIHKAFKLAPHNQLPLSIVFPRNQINNDYLKTCYNNGIKAYRGNQKSFIYKSRKFKNENIFIRLFRFLDSYINITGYNTTDNLRCAYSSMTNIPASFFFRPYNKKLSAFESLKLLRLKKSMKFAAKNNHVFHLWWHPHNFGINQTENLEQLKELLNYFNIMKKKYNMQSLTMRELAILYSNEKA